VNTPFPVNAPPRPPGRTRVKICGLTRPEDARLAARFGADAVGVVFAPGPRQVTLDQAHRILEASPGYVNRVGVFAGHDPPFIWQAVEHCRLEWIQLSGSAPIEPLAGLPARIIRTVHLRHAGDLRAQAGESADAWLLDAPVLPGAPPGGTGRRFDWELARSLPWPRHQVVMAGGLSADNVEALISLLAPGGVDVSSGVELRPGIKDPGRLAAFFEAVARADRRPDGEREES
jgi:phosphoribosylanthranilate isomerase